MRKHTKNLLITITIFLFFLLLDQITKYLTQIYIPYEGTHVKPAFEIDGFISLYKTYNTGMGWSLLSDETGHIILLIISFVASIVLAIFCDNNDWHHAKTLSLGKTLVLAGCVGNLYDRFICILPACKGDNGRPGVVDMVSWKWFDKLTGLFGLGETVFNVADMALTTGLVLIIFDLIFFYSRREKKYGKKANA